MADKGDKAKADSQSPELEQQKQDEQGSPPSGSDGRKSSDQQIDAESDFVSASEVEFSQLLRQALICEQRGRVDEAMPCYDQLCSFLNIERARCRGELLDKLIAHRRSQGAQLEQQLFHDMVTQNEIDLLEAHKSTPGDPTSLVNLGSLHARYTRDLERAVNYFQAALDRDPDCEVARKNLDLAESELDRLDEQQQKFDDAQSNHQSSGAQQQKQQQQQQQQQQHQQKQAPKQQEKEQKGGDGLKLPSRLDPSAPSPPTGPNDLPPAGASIAHAYPTYEPASSCGLDCLFWITLLLVVALSTLLSFTVATLTVCSYNPNNSLDDSATLEAVCAFILPTPLPQDWLPAVRQYVEPAAAAVAPYAAPVVILVVELIKSSLIKTCELCQTLNLNKLK